MRPLTLDVRADLFRVAARFVPKPAQVAARPGIGGVRLEPSRDGGVIMIACDGELMIVLRDETGRISRPTTIAVQRAIIDRAKDLISERNTALPAGVRTRLKTRGGSVWLEPSDGTKGDLEEIHHEFPDWRSMVSPSQAQDGGAPLVISSRASAEISAAALLLSKAAGRQAERAAHTLVRFGGGAGPNWPLVIQFADWKQGFLLVGPFHTPLAPDWERPSWIAPREFTEARAA